MKEYIIGVPERTGVEDPAMVPAINQRELVRCKDCKYGYDTQEGYIACEHDIGTFNSIIHQPDWYCADGKRREPE